MACTADELQGASFSNFIQGLVSFFLGGQLTSPTVNNAYVAALCIPVLEQILGIPSASVFNFFEAEATRAAPSTPTITTALKNISALPLCAVSLNTPFSKNHFDVVQQQPCIYSAAAAANCGSIADLTCVCKNSTFLSTVGKCNQASCDETELQGKSPLAPRKPRGPLFGYTNNMLHRNLTI